MKQKIKVCWLSAGVSSFIAGYLTKDIDEYIYIDIDNQHPDSMRFIIECEKFLEKPIRILKSPYGSVENAIKAFGFINRPKVGAYCTKVLKKECEKNGKKITKITILLMCGDLIVTKSTEQKDY